jgi:hypothetical protein
MDSVGGSVTLDRQSVAKEHAQFRMSTTTNVYKRSSTKNVLFPNGLG